MTLRSLARGSLLITAANLIPRAGAFLLLPIYARFLTPAEYGTVSLAGSAALLLAITYRLGLDAALLRLHHDVDDRERRDLYGTVAIISLAAVMALTLVVLLALPLLLTPSALAAIGPVVVLALAIGGTNVFQYVPSVWYRASDQPGRLFVLSLVAFAATAGVTVLLVVVVRLGAIGSLAGQLAGAAVMAVAAFVILAGGRPWRPRRDLARRAVDFGLPLLPHSAAGWLLNVSDRWILGLLLGLAAADALAAIGIYSFGYQLGYAIGLAAISFNAAWLPFLYQLSDAPLAPRILREATTLVVAGFGAAAAVLAIIAPDLVGLIAPPAWAAAADVTSVVAFASALNAAGLMLASGLYVARRTRIVPLLAFGAVAANLGVNLVLIPRIGIMGAAWATLVAYAVLALATGIAARRRYPLELDAPRLLAIGLAAVVPAVASRVLEVDLGPSVLQHLAWALVAVALAVLVGREPMRRMRRLAAAARPERDPDAASARMAAPKETT